MQSSPPDATLATPADHAACAMLLRGGSKTFQAASFALPADTRRAATALYAFCRQADDAVDLGADGAAELATLHSRLDLIYAGKPLPIAADRAFAEVVASRSIPRELPAALLDGFAWDLEGRRYETLADLNAYAARVAGTVGAMMAVIMGARDPAVLARACDLGVAMQITNIARDVGEDARRGRLYLPREWLAAEGIDADAWLANPQFLCRDWPRGRAPAGARRRVVRPCRGRHHCAADRLSACDACGAPALPRDRPRSPPSRARFRQRPCVRVLVAQVPPAGIGLGRRHAPLRRDAAGRTRGNAVPGCCRRQGVSAACAALGRGPRWSRRPHCLARRSLHAARTGRACSGLRNSRRDTGALLTVPQTG